MFQSQRLLTHSNETNHNIVKRLKRKSKQLKATLQQQLKKGDYTEMQNTIKVTNSDKADLASTKIEKV